MDGVPIRKWFGRNYILQIEVFVYPDSR